MVPSGARERGSESTGRGGGSHRLLHALGPPASFRKARPHHFFIKYVVCLCRLVGVPLLFSSTSSAMIPLMLFAPPHEELADEEIARVLRQSIVDAGCLSRHADVFLAGICADHLVEGLRAAGLLVIRPEQWRLHP